MGVAILVFWFAAPVANTGLRPAGDVAPGLSSSTRVVGALDPHAPQPARIGPGAR